MHPLATREALDSFIAALPSGVSREPTLGAAATVRALYAAAVDARGDGGSVATFADHNLAVLLVSAFNAPGDSALAAAVGDLYFAVRRRLAAALARDPDDLAPAVAMAMGITSTRHAPRLRKEDRLADDFAAIAAALTRPHAGPRLVEAALSAVLDVGRERDAAIAATTEQAVAPLQSAIERLSERLPDHPDLLIARVRLALLAARSAKDAAAALPSLATARGLLDDFARRYGLAAVQRDLYADLIAERTRLGLGGADLKTEAARALALDVAEEMQSPNRTRRLLKALRKARLLDAAFARETMALLQLEKVSRETTENPWDEVRAILLDALGDEKALLQLAERTLAADPHHGPSAKRLFERWLSNIRKGLSAPFDSTMADRVLGALPPATLARLSLSDLQGLSEAVVALFGHNRAFAFVADKVLDLREQRAREGVWDLALALASEVGDPAAMLYLSGLVRGDNASPAVRLAAARVLIEEGRDAEHADELLRSLKNARGSDAREAQALHARLRNDPALREVNHRTLVAFEEKMGIGSGKPLKLRVIYTSPSYALAELRGPTAPDCYEHKHIRTMLRSDDLPDGVLVTDLKKGDGIEAPLRGQDATHKDDKAGLRVYWVSDRSAVSVSVSEAKISEPKSPKTAREKTKEKAGDLPATDDTATVDPREVEADFGVGGGAPVELRVSFDSRKGRLRARIHGPDKTSFPANIRVTPESLPEGLDPKRLGRNGKRCLGLVEAVDEGEKRLYRVVGALTVVPSAGRRGAKGEAPSDDSDDGADTDGTDDGASDATSPEEGAA